MVGDQNKNLKSCICCEKSTKRHRSYLLLPPFTDKHDFIMDYIIKIFERTGRDVFTELDDDDRICRQCFQRGLHWNHKKVVKINKAVKSGSFLVESSSSSSSSN